jgi:hypothetical protein
MVIRSEQMAAFANKAQGDFVIRLKQYLCKAHGSVNVQLPFGKHYCVRGTPDRIITEMVRRAIEKGRLYSISLESSLAAFVTLMFVVAPNFDADPLVHRILTDSKIPANDRVSRACEWISNRHWKRVRRNYDPAAWVAARRVMEAA